MEPIISYEPIGILISAGIMLVTGAVLVVGVFITQSHIPNENDTSAIYFLPNQGLIHTTPGEEISIQIHLQKCSQTTKIRL